MSANPGRRHRRKRVVVRDFGFGKPPKRHAAGDHYDYDYDEGRRTPMAVERPRGLQYRDAPEVETVPSVHPSSYRSMETDQVNPVRRVHVFVGQRWQDISTTMSNLQLQDRTPGNDYASAAHSVSIATPLRSDAVFDIDDKATIELVVSVATRTRILAYEDKLLPHERVLRSHLLGRRFGTSVRVTGVDDGPVPNEEEGAGVVIVQLHGTREGIRAALIILQHAILSQDTDSTSRRMYARIDVRGWHTDAGGCCVKSVWAGSAEARDRALQGVCDALGQGKWERTPSNRYSLRVWVTDVSYQDVVDSLLQHVFNPEDGSSTSTSPASTPGHT